MQRKMPNKAIAIILLMTLTMFQILNAITGIVQAVYEELETQETKISNTNVSFDVYYADTKQHQKEMNIQEGGTLALNINIENTGALTEAKVHVENPNFKIAQDQVNDIHIQSIDSANNDIYLKQLVTGEVTINLPIQFEKQENIETSYFDRLNTFTLTTKYKENESSEKQIEKSIQINTKWTDDVDTTVTSSFSKYLNLADTKTLLEQNVQVTTNNNNLPKETEKLEIQVPLNGEQKPSNIQVMRNGIKVESEYNTETGILKINYTNTPDENQKVTWRETDTYKIVYIYEPKLTVNTIQQTSTINVETKYYTKQEAITKELTQDYLINTTTQLISSEMISTQNMSREYLTVETDKKAYIGEKTTLEIPETTQVTDITINIGNTYFTQGTNKTQTNMNIQSTYINKEEFTRIFGETAEIQVLGENDQIIETINSNTTDETGNYVITYPENTTKATLKIIGTPVQIGEFTIQSLKYFKGNVGLTQEQVNSFEKIENEMILQYSEKTEKITSETNLVTPEPAAKIAVNPTNLVTTDLNKNVEISVELDTKNVMNALYKNPQVTITFPKQLKNITVHSIKSVYEEEMQIIHANKNVNENGCITINLQYEGTQTDYRKESANNSMIIMSADLEFYKDTPSFNENIQLQITNEGNEIKDWNAPITVESKSGLYTYSTLEGYSEETLESLGEEADEIELPIFEEAKQITRKVAIVNNNDFEVKNVELIGSISNDAADTTLKMTYVQALQETQEKAQILYSTEIEGDNWTEKVEDFSAIKRFKIFIETMSSHETMNLSYIVNVPEKLTMDLEGYIKENITYSINEQQMTANNQIVIYTQKSAQILNEAQGTEIKEETNTEETSQTPNYTETIQPEYETIKEANGLKIEMAAISGNTQIHNNDELNEGQGVTYQVKVTNTTNNTINNVRLSATMENAILWNNVEVEGIFPGETGTKMYIYYRPDENCKEYTTEATEIEPNTSYVFKYQITTKKQTETNKTKGNIKILANGIEDITAETYTNPLKDAKIKIEIRSNSEPEKKYYPESYVEPEIIVTNLTNEELSNVDVSIYMPDGLNLTETCYYKEEGEDIQKITLNLEPDENGIIHLPIETLKANEELKYYQNFEILKIDSKKAKEQKSIFGTASVSEETNTSNILEFEITQNQTNITVDFFGNQEKETLETGDKLNLECIVTGNSAIDSQINVYIDIPRGIVVEKAYVVEDGEKREITINEEYNKISENVKLSSKGQSKVVLETKIDESKAIEREATTKVMITPLSGESITKSVTYEFKNVDVIVEDGETSGDTNEDKPSEGDKPSDEDKPSGGNDSPEQTQKNSISGIAWIDNNENGQKDSEDIGISEITVKLLKSQDGTVVKETKTDSSGKYSFEDIENNKYVVTFYYDINTYRPTIYQKNDVAENINSDIIAKESNGQASTDILEIKDNKLSNIDAGFIKNKIFDLKLDKTVTQITIIDNDKSTIKKFNDKKLAKAEIDKKTIPYTTVLMQYKITVTNEGEIPGTVDEIVDYLPKDVTFDNTLNTSWYQGKDKNIYTTSLSKEAINPGETKEVTLILTKKMTENNMGTTFNMAEIAKASNSKNIADKDSIPNNKVETEDDFSQANIIISVKTGIGVVINVGIIIAALVVIALYIKRRRRK